MNGSTDMTSVGRREMELLLLPAPSKTSPTCLALVNIERMWFLSFALPELGTLSTAHGFGQSCLQGVTLIIARQIRPQCLMLEQRRARARRTPPAFLVAHLKLFLAQ